MDDLRWQSGDRGYVNANLCSQLFENDTESILLIGGNFSPELTGIGKYNGEMINWLAERGHICTVITTYPYYPDWNIKPPYAKKAFWYSKEYKTTENNPNRNIKIYRCRILFHQTRRV